MYLEWFLMLMVFNVYLYLVILYRKEKGKMYIIYIQVDYLFNRGQKVKGLFFEFVGIYFVYFVIYMYIYVDNLFLIRLC